MKDNYFASFFQKNDNAKYGKQVKGQKTKKVKNTNFVKSKHMNQSRTSN